MNLRTFFGQTAWAAMLAALLIVSAGRQSHAADAATKTVKSEKMSTTYSISDGSVSITTEIKNDQSRNTLMTKYLLKPVLEALKTSPFVSSYGVTSQKAKLETNDWSFQNYNELKRTSYVYINLTLPTHVTMLLKADEDLHVCKGDKPGTTGAAVTDTDSAACDLGVKLEFTGPLVVYGLYASNKVLNANELLKNKQSVSIELSKSYDLKDTTMTTQFEVNSMSWEKNLFEFLDSFNVHVQPELVSHNVIARKALFLGIARYARTINERILQ